MLNASASSVHVNTALNIVIQCNCPTCSSFSSSSRLMRSSSRFILQADKLRVIS